MKDFKQWAKENPNLIKGQDIHILYRVWDAAKLSALNNVMELMNKGVIQVTPTIQPEADPPG